MVWICRPDLARTGPTRPAKQQDMHGPLVELASHWHFATFIRMYYVQIERFLNKLILSIDYTVESQQSWSDNSASPRFGSVKIDSQVSNFVHTAK